MSFSYDAGTSTPTYAGLVEFDGVRINDGTFKSQRVPPIVDSPPLSDATSAYANDDGGVDGTTLIEPWTFDLELWLWVPTGAGDIPAAIDYLRGAFNIVTGLSTLTVNAPGWSAARMLTARVAGQIVVAEPDITSKKVPTRDVTIPMIATDPVVYSLATRVVTINTGSSGTVTNAGNKRTHFIARFNGPLTNPALVSPGGAKLALGPMPDATNVVIASGHYIEVQSNPAAVGGVTAIDDLGVSVYDTIAAFNVSTIGTGTPSWSVTSDAGSGNVRLTTQDAWA